MDSHEMVDQATSAAPQGAVVNGEAVGQGANGGAGAERWARGDEIAVENPATGEVIATVQGIDAAALAEMAKRGRDAQIGWHAMGFEGRGEVLRRAQKWTMDNAERVISTIVAETGKTYEDAQLAELAYAANAFGFWAKKAPKYLADEHVSSSQILVKGKKLRVRYRPLGLIGVIGPWNYPLTNSFGDCIPALMAGNSVILRQAAHSDLARARRQGPDDRARGRGHRARGELRHVLLDAERGADVHLDRARIRRGAGLRRFRAPRL
jgi:acyl-CoA reductase-like NAD-dependent aldehyde dehydrogenase